MIKIVRGINKFFINTSKEEEPHLPKLMELCSWESRKKYFYIKDSDYNKLKELIRYFRNNSIEIIPDSESLNTIKIFEDYDKRANSPKINLPPSKPINGINTLLSPAQYSGITFIEESGGRAIIGLDTGTGKTLSFLGYCIKNNLKAIIICPSQAGKTKKSIYKEIKDRTDKKAIIIWDKTIPDLSVLLGNDFIIINYDIAEKFYSLILNLIVVFGYNTLGIDESHNIKNIKSLRYKLIKQFSDIAKNVILMSATTSKNNIYELFPQLNIVAPSKFSSYREFISKYGAKKVLVNGRYVSIKTTSLQLMKLNEDIQGCYYWIPKEDIIDDYKKTIFKQILCKPSPLYFCLRGRGFPTKRHEVQYLAREAIPFTVELVNKLLKETNRKIIVYSWFRHTSYHIKDSLGEICVLNNGSQNQSERTFSYEQFKTNSSVRVVSATIRSFSESINLQEEGNIVIFNDLPYTPADIEQGNGRVNRRGQIEDCYCYIIRFEDTGQDRIFEILNEKYAITEAVLHARKGVTLDSKITP